MLSLRSNIQICENVNKNSFTFLTCKTPIKGNFSTFSIWKSACSNKKEQKTFLSIKIELVGIKMEKQRKNRTHEPGGIKVAEFMTKRAGSILDKTKTARCYCSMEPSFQIWSKMVHWLSKTDMRPVGRAHMHFLLSNTQKCIKIHNYTIHPTSSMKFLNLTTYWALIF